MSWKKHHNYLTLVTGHDAGKVVWGRAGKGTAALDTFFGQIGPQQAGGIEAVSMDMGPAYAKSVRTQGHAPQAVICYDPFHAVKIVTGALDVERRKAWNELRAGGNGEAAKTFKGARWALLVWVDDASPTVVLANYTLAAHVIEQQTLSKKLGRGLPRQLPAVLLARLAQDRSLHGQGLGGAVLAEAMGRIKHVTADLGARFIVVDAIDPQAANFYEHYGFSTVPDQQSMRLVYRLG